MSLGNCKDYTINLKKIKKKQAKKKTHARGTI